MYRFDEKFKKILAENLLKGGYIPSDSLVTQELHRFHRSRGPVMKVVVKFVADWVDKRRCDSLYCESYVHFGQVYGTLTASCQTGEIEAVAIDYHGSECP